MSGLVDQYPSKRPPVLMSFRDLPEFEYLAQLGEVAYRFAQLEHLVVEGSSSVYQAAIIQGSDPHSFGDKEQVDRLRKATYSRNSAGSCVVASLHELHRELVERGLVAESIYVRRARTLYKKTLATRNTIFHAWPVIDSTGDDAPRLDRRFLDEKGDDFVGPDGKSTDSVRVTSGYLSDFCKKLVDYSDQLTELSKTLVLYRWPEYADDPFVGEKSLYDILSANCHPVDFGKNLTNDSQKR